ncbi:MAG: hypothetical protein ACLQJR_01165 [Stellaceae bacterium]
MTAAPLLALGLLGGLALAGAPAAAQHFSADLVTSPAGSATGKLYVADGKVRIETPDFPGGFFLVDGDAKSAYFVRPAQRVFMAARQSTRLTRILVPLDPDDPCGQWQAMAESAGAAASGERWQCERLGGETIDGRETVKYRALSPQHRQHDGWVAPDLRFVVRLETEDGAVLELRNITEGPQPPELFVLPAGYRKFDPQRLIDRIKHSDVWVEAPK